MRCLLYAFTARYLHAPSKPLVCHNTVAEQVSVKTPYSGMHVLSTLV